MNNEERIEKIKEALPTGPASTTTGTLKSRKRQPSAKTVIKKCRKTPRFSHGDIRQ